MDPSVGLVLSSLVFSGWAFSMGKLKQEWLSQDPSTHVDDGRLGPATRAGERLPPLALHLVGKEVVMRKQKMCVECGKRPARSKIRGRARKEIVQSKHHQLCAQCYRALRDSMRGGRPYGRGKRRIVFDGATS
jgi:hypothetical protein